MNNDDWALILESLHDVTNPEKAGQAASDLLKFVSEEDTTRLLEVLNEDDFFIREIAAVALCQLNAIPLLRTLLVALEKGFDDGHDNDSLLAALSDMAMMNKEAVKAKLIEIRNGADKKLEENIDWLMEYCE